MYQKGEDVYYTPDELGYRDRGMMKWQGFILSDHNELMEKEEKVSQGVSPKPYQGLKQRAEVLQEAFQTKRHVAIQMDYVENGLYPADVMGKVTGIDEGRVLLETDIGVRFLELDEIRHISLLDTTKWYFRDDNH